MGTTWWRGEAATRIGSSSGIYAQRYNASGVAQGSEFRVNSTTAGEQQHPAVAMDVNGNFMVVWASQGQDAAGTWGIYKQEYNADGTANGGEVRVNSTTGGDQLNPAVAMNAVGQAVVAWAGNGTGDGSGVFFQRYATALVVDTVSNTYDSSFASGTVTISQLLSDKGTDGKISLREAIFAANNTANANANSPDRIYFNIAGAGPHTIALSSALPNITDALIIDGTSAPDFAGTPVVELNGVGAGAAAGLTLAAGSSGSTIKGLAINRFAQEGILITRVVEQCHQGQLPGNQRSGHGGSRESGRRVDHPRFDQQHDRRHHSRRSQHYFGQHRRRYPDPQRRHREQRGARQLHRPGRDRDGRSWQHQPGCGDLRRRHQ